MVTSVFVQIIRRSDFTDLAEIHNHDSGADSFNDCEVV
jgi:hypothetical protein